MQNPFRKDDAVLTMVRGKQVEATVTQTWKNEVQVKATTGDLLWRTMYTVWYPGAAPLARDQKTEKSVGVAISPNKSTPAPRTVPKTALKARSGKRKSAKKRR